MLECHKGTNVGSVEWPIFMAFSRAKVKEEINTQYFMSIVLVIVLC